MSVEKKSLISSRTVAKKAVIARESGAQVTAASAKVAPMKRPMILAPSKKAGIIAPSKKAAIFAPMKKAAIFAPMKKV